ncbi:MAG: hypothetical protein IKR27_03220 [Lachnospiraceae bacterium]|nr:hypothetical protein [Lachnospiraceae bacterium]
MVYRIKKYFAFIIGVIIVCESMINETFAIDIELPDDSVYASEEEQDKLFQLIINNSADNVKYTDNGEMKHEINDDGWIEKIVKESIMPVYTFDVFEYARSGDIIIERKEGWYCITREFEDGTYTGDSLFEIVDNVCYMHGGTISKDYYLRKVDDDSTMMGNFNCYNYDHNKEWLINVLKEKNMGEFDDENARFVVEKQRNAFHYIVNTEKGGVIADVRRTDPNNNELGKVYYIEDFREVAKKIMENNPRALKKEEDERKKTEKNKREKQIIYCVVAGLFFIAVIFVLLLRMRLKQKKNY